MSRISLADVQKAYQSQYGNQSNEIGLDDIKKAYQQQYGQTGSSPSLGTNSALQNVMPNIGHGLLRGAQIGGAALSKIGRGMGDLEWEGIHKLGNLLGVTHGPAQTYNDLYGSPEKNLGLPDTPNYHRAVNLTSALIGAAIPGGIQTQMAMGAIQSPNNPLLGAGLGAAGVGAGKALGGVANLLKKPAQYFGEKIQPSEKMVKAVAKNWMNKLSGARKDLKNTYDTGYGTVKIAGDEAVHDPIVGYEYPDKMEDLPEDVKPLTVQNSFPDSWHQVKSEVLAKNSPVHPAYDNFEANPTFKNADKLKKALNEEWPKPTDKDYSAKINLINDGKNILRHEFISPTLARYDAQNGTDLWNQYMNADKAFSKEIQHFGKNNKLDVATKGGAYSPSEYKELVDVLNKAVKEGKAPVAGPVHLAAQDIKNAMKQLEMKQAIASGRGPIAKTTLKGLGGLSELLNIPAAGLQGSALLSRPIAQLMAQRENQ